MSTAPVLRGRVLAVLRADDSPAGMLRAEIVAATGLTAMQVSCVIQGAGDAIAKLGGKCARKHWRYAVAERAEVCRPAFDALIAAHKEECAERRRERRRKANPSKRGPKPTVKTEKQKAPVEAKPKSPRKPKHKQRAMTVAAPVHVPAKQPQKVAWANAVPIIPPHVKVTKCPGYTGDRWQVSVPVGGFVSEWKTLRSSRKAA